LPDTISDRSIVITMKRKRRDEVVERFRKRKVKAYANALVPQLEAWAIEFGLTLQDAEPDLPEELNDRMQDATEALIAIADLLGNGDVARAAIVEVAGDEPETHESTRLKVLRDLRSVWANWPNTNMPSSLILPALHMLDPSWANYYDRGPLKDTDLAALMSYFGMKPMTVWIPAGSLQVDGEPMPGHDAKGYKFDELADAWSRYLDGDEMVTV
jgi:hypothetical protein